MNIFKKLLLVLIYIFFNTSHTSEKLSIQNNTTSEDIEKSLETIFNKSTLEFLIKSGLSTGMSVLDMGSHFTNEEGDLAYKLGTIVGINGLVKSIHIEEESFNRATVYTQNLPQVQHELYNTKQPNVFDIFSKLPIQSYDLIYIRLEAFTSTCIENKKTLQNIEGVLRPNGILIIEEPLNNIIQCYPENKFLTDFITFAQQCLAIAKKNPHAYKISELLTTHFQSPVNMEISTPLLRTNTEKKLLHFLVQEIRSDLAKKPLTIPQEITSREHTLTGFIENPSSFATYMQALQTCVKKKQTFKP